MSKSHLLLNANILGLNTALLCVVEYDDSFYPMNVYTIAKYDEMEDTLKTKYDLFPNLNKQVHKESDSFDKFLEIQNWMEVLNYQNNKASTIEICGYEISKHLKEKHNVEIDSLEVELDELYIFIKECFHKEYLIEDNYKKQIKSNPFAKILLEDLLEKRKLN